VFRTIAPLTAAAVLGLAACGKTPAGAPAATSQEPQAAYVAPPSVLSVTAAASGPALSGVAPPNARIRLATPGGEARFAQANGAGAWSLGLPPSPEARIFGLSAATGGRQVQAQGYVLISPDGRAGLLRAGAGALRLDRRPPMAVGAVDFDREGSTVVSGTAPAQAYLSVEVDGAQAAQGRADAQGRFSIALQAPLRAGRHQISVLGDGVSETARFEATPAAPLAPGPIHSQVTSDGLRVDWPTPGGGIQSTVLVN
jgi:hypothetical protein